MAFTINWTLLALSYSHVFLIFFNLIYNYATFLINIVFLNSQIFILICFYTQLKIFILQTFGLWSNFLRRFDKIHFRRRMFKRWFLCFFDFWAMIRLIAVHFRCTVIIFHWLFKLSNLKNVFALISILFLFVLKKIIWFFQSSFQSGRLTILISLF